MSPYIRHAIEMQRSAARVFEPTTDRHLQRVAPLLVADMRVHAGALYRMARAMMAMEDNRTA